jgi:superfamily II DNA helicase RecQ
MIEVICQNKTPGAVFVLPTAGGKSLAYIVPSLCDPAPSITVAIIPYIAIKEETYAKALTFGLHAVDYQPSYKDTIPLLLVSVEHIV